MMDSASVGRLRVIKAPGQPRNLNDQQAMMVSAALGAMEVFRQRALEFGRLAAWFRFALMGMAGTKYLPSAYYKIRTLPFQSEAMQAQVPAARGITAPGRIDDEV